MVCTRERRRIRASVGVRKKNYSMLKHTLQLPVSPVLVHLNGSRAESNHHISPVDGALHEYLPVMLAFTQRFRASSSRRPAAVFQMEPHLGSGARKEMEES